MAKATGRCERCDLTARDNSTSDNDNRKYLVSFCYDDRIHTHVCKEGVPTTRLHVISSQALRTRNGSADWIQVRGQRLNGDAVG